MIHKDRIRFAAAITALAEAYRQTITEATIKAYELGLDDLAIEEIESAVRKALRTCKFMPAAIELRQLSGAEVSSDARAVLAWDAFQNAVTAHGGYRTVQFDDPVINATVRNLGGWERCCEMPTEQFDNWLRKDFLKTYTALHSAGVGPEASRPLVGYFGRENAGLGHNHPASERVVLVHTGLPGLPELEGPKDVRPQIGFAANVGKLPE